MARKPARELWYAIGKTAPAYHRIVQVILATAQGQRGTRPPWRGLVSGQQPAAVNVYGRAGSRTHFRLRT